MLCNVLYTYNYIDYLIMKKLLYTLAFTVISLSVIFIGCASDDSKAYEGIKNSIYSSSVYQLHLDTKNLQINLFINDVEIKPEPYGYQTDSSRQYFDGRNKLVLNRFLYPGENTLRIEFTEFEKFKGQTGRNMSLMAQNTFASFILVEGILTNEQNDLSAESVREKLKLEGIDVISKFDKSYRKLIPETISHINEFSYTFTVDSDGFVPFSSEYCNLTKFSSNIESAELTLNSYSALKIESSDSYVIPSLFSVGREINEAELHVYSIIEAGQPGSLKVSTDCELAPLLRASGISDDILQDINGYRADWYDTTFPFIAFNFERIGVYQPL